MLRVCDQLGQAARADLPVLILGEPGTGKTLAARMIHARSIRSGGEFVTVNCATLPETIVEPGSRGGPRVVFEAPQFLGYVRRASGGTLFLDEIADLGPQAQERLLTLFERGAGNSPVEALVADVRLIAATRRDVDEAVASGAFRRELFERLCRMTVAMPPLRERQEDVPDLAAAFIREFALEHARRVDRLSARARDLLMTYHWPGNVRELRVAIERAVVVASGPVIHHHHLPAAVQQQPHGSRPVPPLALTEALNAYEGELLRDALRQARGIRSKAARLLGTTERILSYRLRKLGIDWRPFKETG
jgi:Nif-specific regulatory protein